MQSFGGGFGRGGDNPFFEEFMTEDAEYVLFGMGSLGLPAKVMVRRLRELTRGCARADPRGGGGLVVAADGVRSAVRAALGVETNEPRRTGTTDTSAATMADVKLVTCTPL